MNKTYQKLNIAITSNQDEYLAAYEIINLNRKELKIYIKDKIDAHIAANIKDPAQYLKNYILGSLSLSLFDDILGFITSTDFADRFYADILSNVDASLIVLSETMDAHHLNYHTMQRFIEHDQSNKLNKLAFRQFMLTEVFAHNDDVIEDYLNFENYNIINRLTKQRDKLRYNGNLSAFTESIKAYDMLITEPGLARKLVISLEAALMADETDVTKLAKHMVLNDMKYPLKTIKQRLTVIDVNSIAYTSTAIYNADGLIEDMFAIAEMDIDLLK